MDDRRPAAVLEGHRRLHALKQRALFVVLPLFIAAAMPSRWIAERGASALKLPAAAVGVEYPVAYARIAALSFRSLTADLFWISFLQDLPLSAADPDTGRHLAHSLAATLALDPSFHSAYVHGPIMLSVLGNQQCAALGIAEEGMARYPDDWRLPFNAGYFCFAEIGDYACAARNMRIAAAIPGSPRWLPGLVARLLAHSDQRDAAIEYLQAQLANPALTSDPRIRDRLADRLRDAIFSRDAAQLEDAVRRWRLSHEDRLPASLQDLVTAGLVPAIPPQDPYGGRYQLSPDARIVSSTGNKGLVIFRNESAFSGSFEERLFDVRVSARLAGALGEPVFLRDALDLFQNLHEAAKDLAAWERWDPDPDHRRDLRAIEARIMMRDEIDRMKAAQFELLRERPGAAPTLAEIETRAGSHPEDAFGTPYRLDDSGRPSPGFGRQPEVTLDEPGASSCR